jgi:hypothetical protein
MVHKRKPPSCNGGGSLRTPLGGVLGGPESADLYNARSDARFRLRKAPSSVGTLETTRGGPHRPG